MSTTFRDLRDDSTSPDPPPKLIPPIGKSNQLFSILFFLTQKPEYLYRACCFMDWCMEEHPGTELHHPDRPASLFEGLVGRLYLAEDLGQILHAKFPAQCL